MANLPFPLAYDAEEQRLYLADGDVEPTVAWMDDNADNDTNALHALAIVAAVNAPAGSVITTDLCTALRWALDKIPATSEAGQSATYAGAYDVLWAAEEAAPAVDSANDTIDALVQAEAFIAGLGEAEGVTDILTGLRAAIAREQATPAMLEALQFALGVLNWYEESPAEMAAQAPDAIGCIEQAIAAAQGKVSADPVRDAAPAMLAALKAVVAALNGRVHSQPALKALHDADAAIAAAEGRANG